MQERKPKYLSGINRLVSEMIKRDLTRGTAHESEIFICGKCQGNGKYCRVKGVIEECDHCNGEGRIKLSFTIDRVDL
ncbi:heat shock protein DnaJ [Vibrio phage 1.084.O._10N.261.49.F5]|nr:heat shock protein DnaJ [Vibrio phage 1.084.O._10N.261.49.F5]